MAKWLGKFLEPVIKLFMQRNFSVSKRRQRAGGGGRGHRHLPLLIMVYSLITAVFMPHTSTEELAVGVESLVVEVIDRPCMKMLGCMSLKRCYCWVQISVYAIGHMKCSGGLLDMEFGTFVYIRPVRT
jgi:hypothetical protein